MSSRLYTVKAAPWLWQGGKGSWHFITLPKEQSDEIRVLNADRKRGWGSIPVIATVGNTSWKTSIFPYKEVNAYILPLKAEVRKKEKIKEGGTITVTLEIGG